MGLERKLPKWTGVHDYFSPTPLRIFQQIGQYWTRGPWWLCLDNIGHFHGDFHCIEAHLRGIYHSLSKEAPLFFLEQWHGETRVLQVQMTGKSMGLEAFRAESYPNWLAGFVSRSSFFWMCLTSPVSQPSAIAGHGCAVPLCCSPKWLDPIVNHAFWVCFIYFSAGKWWLYTSENTIYTFS